MIDRRDMLKFAAAGASGLRGAARAGADAGKTAYQDHISRHQGRPARRRRCIQSRQPRCGQRHAIRDRLRHGRQPATGQCRRAASSVKYIFISHHHSDHNLEYGNLFYNAWAAGRSTPIHSFGPKGIEAMTRTYWELNKFDVDTRIEDEGRPDPRPLLVAKDITEDGVVLQTADVKVTAFRTPHPPIVDSFAYKFETPDGVIVFSSDTAYNPKLAEFAKGADVLVHEALYVPAVDRLVIKTKNGATLKKHLMESHTTTEDVGRIAAAAGVKVLVLSHFVPGDDPEVTDEDWIEGARKNFSGKIIVAKDLMQLALPV